MPLEDGSMFELALGFYYMLYTKQYDNLPGENTHRYNIRIPPLVSQLPSYYQIFNYYTEVFEEMGPRSSIPCKKKHKHLNYVSFLGIGYTLFLEISSF